MRVGVTIFLTDLTIYPVELARAVEERGFGSLWFPEHTHIPISRATPAPMGEPLPEEYRRTFDPIVALSAASAVTNRLSLGTGISLVAQRDPIVLAKSLATLDVISGGRVEFGVGFGWNREELEDHGVAFENRRDVVRERVLAIRSLWRDEIASFDGRHVSLSPSWAWPKPIQQPGLRVLVGGAAGPTLFRHIAEWGDGWLPIGGAGVRGALPALHDVWASAGRTGAPAVVPFGVELTAAKLDYFHSIGCAEVVARLPSAPEATVLHALDDLAREAGLA